MEGGFKKDELQAQQDDMVKRLILVSPSPRLGLWEGVGVKLAGVNTTKGGARIVRF